MRKHGSKGRENPTWMRRRTDKSPAVCVKAGGRAYEWSGIGERRATLVKR
ncbi:MAG: hypothetical protein ABIJ96_05790 [Elusimicrobiota bacterium]